MCYQQNIVYCIIRLPSVLSIIIEEDFVIQKTSPN